MKNKMKMKLVLNRAYGGFSIDDEMARWLIDNKGWQPVKYDYKLKDTYKLKTIDISSHSDLYFCPHQDEIEFRSHPDLIECVRALKELHKNKSYAERRNIGVFDLKIVDVEVSFGVENYNDGYERVNVDTSMDFEKE